MFQERYETSALFMAFHNNDNRVNVLFLLSLSQETYALQEMYPFTHAD
jgi:hypothetical protein